jgi:acid stress chaperone HdeB
MNSVLEFSSPKQYVFPPYCPVILHSVIMPLPEASPIASRFLYSPEPMAPAQVTVDVSKITCDELVKCEIADPKLIAIRISGYYQGLRKNPIVDKHQTLQSIDKLEEYSFKHPNDLVMNEVGELLGAR